MADIVGAILRSPSGVTWLTPNDRTVKQYGLQTLSSSNGSTQTFTYTISSGEKPWVRVLSGGPVTITKSVSGTTVTITVSFTFGGSTTSGSVSLMYGAG